MAHYLICYDIANPRRLARVHRRIVKDALFIQFSVYYLQGRRKDLDVLLNDLRELINEREDDIRAYTVQPLQEALQIGAAWLPEGIVFG